MTPSRFALARLTLVEALAVAALLDTAPLADVGSLPRATTTQLSAALAWWVAAAITAWLVVTTLACVASRAVPALRALRLVDALTAPGVRRIVDGALACSLAAGTPLLLTAPASARTSPTTAPPPVVYVAPNGEVIISPSTTAAPTTTSTTTPSPPAPVASQPAPSPTPPPPAPAPHRSSPAPSCRASERNPCGGATRTGEGRHVVVAGDNLWAIAAARLGTNRAADVAPYWRRVVAVNRPTLRSGDPNLIYPGELVALPAVA
jgi:nucleoid-associated protein YgaU